MATRISKEEYYLGIAKAVAQRSPCLRRQIGAIIVKEDAIVSTGYNGPARGVVNCLNVGCLKNKKNMPSYSGYDFCIGVHAEENAVLNAARNGSGVLGGTLFLAGIDTATGSICELRPCDRCKRVIINAGIKKVYAKKPDGSIDEMNVEKWVKEESERYTEQMKE